MPFQHWRQGLALERKVEREVEREVEYSPEYTPECTPVGSSADLHGSWTTPRHQRGVALSLALSPALSLALSLALSPALSLALSPALSLALSPRRSRRCPVGAANPTSDLHGSWTSPRHQRGPVLSPAVHSELYSGVYSVVDQVDQVVIGWWIRWRVGSGRFL